MIRKVANVLSWTVIIAMLLVFGTVTVMSLGFGVRFMAVKTPSMEPELPVGCLVAVKQVEFDEINIGDDITYVFDNSSTTVTHRVIDIDEKGYITTKGLSNNTADAPISYDNVVGKVIFSVNYVGKWFMLLTTTSGKIIVVSIVAVIMLISGIVDKFADKNNVNKAK